MRPASGGAWCRAGAGHAAGRDGSVRGVLPAGGEGSALGRDSSPMERAKSGEGDNKERGGAPVGSCLEHSTGVSAESPNRELAPVFLIQLENSPSDTTDLRLKEGSPRRWPGLVPSHRARDARSVGM